MIYYARAVDPTILPEINEITSQQPCPTKLIIDKTSILMDYSSTHPHATIRYHTGDMCLHIDSDAAYLVLPNARSRGVGYLFLSSSPSTTETTPTPQPNGTILTECTTIKRVVSSATKEEAHTVYNNVRVAVPIRVILD